MVRVVGQVVVGMGRVVVVERWRRSMRKANAANRW
jgi:hypothetical protein